MRELTRLVIMLLLVCPNFSCIAFELEGHFNLGLAGMAFINGQLEEVANREGTTFSPIQLVWGLEVNAWFWPFSGFGISFLSGSGEIHGREPRPQNVTSLGVEGKIFVPPFLLNWPVDIEVGGGGYLAFASGLLTGGGWAFGGYLRAKWKLLELGQFQTEVALTWRYLPVLSIYNEREEITPQGSSALDFSGLYVGVIVKWK